jgi:hypothetical protein
VKLVHEVAEVCVSFALKFTYEHLSCQKIFQGNILKPLLKGRDEGGEGKNRMEERRGKAWNSMRKKRN